MDCKMILLAVSWLSLSCQSAQNVTENDFKTIEHPRIFVTKADKEALWSKVENVSWAKDIYEQLHKEVDPILDIHKKDPSYVISRMQMHWEDGKRYTHFYTDGNFIPRREGNAKYPTVRVTYGRAASNSVPLAPLDKIIPYGDGSLTKPVSVERGIVKIDDKTMDMLSRLGMQEPFDTVPFTKTGLGTETVNRAFIHLAWKSSILYYLTDNKDYAKLTADILWNFVRGASQQEEVNPDWEIKNDQLCHNGYLSYETLGDTRHFATLPLAYDMIYDYLHEEYFKSEQFRKGLPGELWAPPHTEGENWALERFEIYFKKQIENKLNRGGGLKGNWNTNEHQSAMLYALALEPDYSYKDKKGRAYYVSKLIYGPTNETHGAYTDVLRANVSPTTGLWPEAPGGYGQGSISQLIRFGYIYYRNGIDLLSKDTLLVKMSGSMPQMLFPNGYVTNYGDATYSTINTDQIELMLAYSHEKGDVEKEKYFSGLMKYSKKRNFNNEFYYSLFFYLPEIPATDKKPDLPRTSYSKDYSLVFERNLGANEKDALAFTLMGFGKATGHRQPNGMNMELYGRGHVLAPDQGIGQDYWSRDTHEYKINVAGHNTVAPNGRGADNSMPQDLEIVCAEPSIREGEFPVGCLSQRHQFVEAHNHFYTKELKAEQRRMMSIVRTSTQTGYFVDIFHSKLVDGQSDRYHDYIYHNMGIDFQIADGEGEILLMSDIPLDSLSGKGYGFFNTLGSLKTGDDFVVDFNLGVDDTHMRMFMPGCSGRTIYKLNSLFNHRYYEPPLKNIPVPAVLVRQDGEAWDKPFVAIYEPYGNGAEAILKKVYTEKTLAQKGVAKLTVEYRKKGRMDRIVHSVNPEEKSIYCGIEFRGTYCVVSFDDGKLKSLYMGNAKSFKLQDISIISCSNKPFNIYLEIKDGKPVYKVDGEVNIKLEKI